jgi:hypothetical protein
MPFPPLICRWPNGDISLVAAESRTEADYVLDEIQNPDGAELLPLNHPIAIHFSLKTASPGDSITDALELDHPAFNEALEESIGTRAYPVLSEVLAKPRCTQKMIDAALDQEKQPIGEKKPELSEHPGAAHVQSTLEMPRSVAEALAETAENDEEDDEALSDDSELDEEGDDEFGDDSELDKLYEQLEAESNPYFRMRTACKLIFVASAQDRITHIGQTFSSPEGIRPAIITSFVTCPFAVATDLRALLDRTIQQFLRDHGIAAAE